LQQQVAAAEAAAAAHEAAGVKAAAHHAAAADQLAQALAQTRSYKVVAALLALRLLQAM
jgi:hypothetical protein